MICVEQSAKSMSATIRTMRSKHRANMIQVIIASGIMLIIIVLINKLFANIILNIISVLCVGCFVYVLIMQLLRNDFLNYIISYFKRR